MKTISITELKEKPSLYSQAAEVLSRGELLCFPASSGYKLAADLESPDAIMSMLQAKRRVKNAPALVLVPGVKWVDEVAMSVSTEAKALMKELWPCSMTMLFEASERLNPKVRKPLTKAKGWLGVRMPQDEVSVGVVKSFGKPILVSSANLAEKQGARSVAQVKKNFGRTVQLLIDAGDLADAPNSTLIDATGEKAVVVRAGAVPEEKVMEVLSRHRSPG